MPPKTKMQKEEPDKIALENIRIPSQLELETVSDVWANFYKWRSYRSGSIQQLQGLDLETYLGRSRELFWNAMITSSEDLRALGLEFSIPFVRKETLDYVGKVVGQDIKPRFNGEGLDIFGVKVLQSIYDKWRFKSNDKVEKFWQTLYGTVNGTVPIYVGYNNAKTTRRYLKNYDKKTGDYKLEEKKEPYWNDVWTEIAPLEDIYLPKIYERNIQKQGRMQWKTEMDFKDFKREFRTFDNAEYVHPGNQIAEDSLYFRLLSGSGVTSSDRIQVLKEWDTLSDTFVINANGIWLNPVGKGRKQIVAPNPFDHKMLPFVWGIGEAIDEKFAYGLSLPFKIKDPHKLMNTSYTMLVERELRAIEPPILTSDFDAPKLIFGQNNVIPVNDVNAYKELKISEASGPYFNMMAGLQSVMTSQAQGGAQQTGQGRQPKSAKEAQQMAAMQQQAFSTALLMFYDIIRQETILILKTALQFYPVDKYQKVDSRIIRSLTVPNGALSTGGTGQIEVRFVKKKKADIELFFEAIHKSIMNGKMTEIIEAPISAIQDLEFEITSIDLEPSQSEEMKQTSFIANVINPMINTYIPMGLADPGKVFLRHLEKLGEHPADFASDKALGQLMTLWGEQTNVTLPSPNPNPGGAGGGSGPSDITKPPVSGQQNASPAAGNALQSTNGMKFGGQNTGPLPAPASV